MFIKLSIEKVLFLFIALNCFISHSKANVEDEKAFSIAKQNACLGCHAIHKKLLAQAFRQWQKNIRATRMRKHS